MKGVILAGGMATRLRPLTWITNKHLLPIYNKPMIYFALESMARAGIKDVLITSSPDHCGHFINLLKSGAEFGLKLSYAIQDKPGGISEAINLAKDFVGKDSVLVILGDNIFFDSLENTVKEFDKTRSGSVVFAKKMPTESKQYGVVEMDDEGNVLSIEEKPEHPKSDLAQTGIYIYDFSVFSRIEKLKPSKRGELEVTDLNNSYLKEGKLKGKILNGLWIDAGTSYDELLTANIQVSELVKNGK
jgi:glucose-1-phosphate thymidylyltransferase